MDTDEIKETLSDAESYVISLKNLDLEIKDALTQIETTSVAAENDVQDHFSNLQEFILRKIEARKNELLSRIRSGRRGSISPLLKCSSIIKHKIEETEKLITLGQSLQNHKTKNRKSDVEKLFDNSTLLGSLPEVPSLKEVPYFTFEFDNTHEMELSQIIANCGSVTSIAPVQISQMTEKPGAILVEWQVVDIEEKSVDIQEFCLQKAFGDAKENKLSFQTCYQGIETQYLVKDLKVNEYYSFRVSCKFEGSDKICRWSLPQIYRTKLEPFSWKEMADYSMNDNFKIAKPSTELAPLLISNGPQFKVGDTIEFTILEKDEKTAFLGIVTDHKIESLTNLVNPEGSFILSSNGEIQVDGFQKSTHLPVFMKNSKVTFSCESMNDDRIVIHIDLNDKRVTYEWGVNKTNTFYFAAELPSAAWKILVE